MGKIDDLIQKNLEFKRQYQEQAQAAFKEMAKEFFDKNPGLTAVKWCQYTPYFNDGEPCVFGIGEVVFTNASEDELENVSPWGDYEGDDENVFASNNIKYTLESGRDWHKETAEKIRNSGGVDPDSCNEFENAVHQLDDVMLEMFGDHVQITMTREGFEIDEYSHD
jgi:hypothetical protein